jgi:hypothetical protein
MSFDQVKRKRSFPHHSNIISYHIGRPIDITEYCRLCPLISNLVEISWFTQDISIPLPNYIASVFLTERKTVPQLLARISRPSAIRPSNETQRTIIQTLSTQQASHEIDDDLEVASTSLRIPLECPAMRIRMRLPGRATTCKHVHCFDLEGYLRMNEKKPSRGFSFYLLKSLFFNLFQLGFVLYVINRRYIPIYFWINFLLIFLRNVHRRLKLLNMKSMDNGK